MKKVYKKQLTLYIDNGTLLLEELCDLYLDKTYGKENEIVNKSKQRGNTIEGLVSFADLLRLERMELQKPIREISVIAFKLVNENTQNIETFIDDKSRAEKLKKLDIVMEKVNNKYNYNLVKMGYLAEPWWNRYMEMAKQDAE